MGTGKIKGSRHELQRNQIYIQEKAFVDVARP